MYILCMYKRKWLSLTTSKSRKNVARSPKNSSILVFFLSKQKNLDSSSYLFSIKSNCCFNESNSVWAVLIKDYMEKYTNNLDLLCYTCTCTHSQSSDWQTCLQNPVASCVFLLHLSAFSNHFPFDALALI